MGRAVIPTRPTPTTRSVAELGLAEAILLLRGNPREEMPPATVVAWIKERPTNCLRNRGKKLR